MLAAEDRFQHDLGTQQGENLYAGTAVEVQEMCVHVFFSLKNREIVFSATPGATSASCT